MQAAVRTILSGIGEDPTREGLLDTPKRVAKATVAMLAGYGKTGASTIGDALFHEEILSGNEPGVVLVRDIEFASLSEDTLLPFHGRAHIAYLPSNGTVLGLSKLARLTNTFSKRVQQQETLQKDLLHALMTHVNASGAMVVLEASHLTFAQPKQPVRVTAAVSGSFARPCSSTPSEVLAMLGMSAHTKLAYFEETPADIEVEVSDVLDQDTYKASKGPSCCAKPCYDVTAASGTTLHSGINGNSEVLVGAAYTLLQEAARSVGVELPPTRLQASAQRYIANLIEATSGFRNVPPVLQLSRSASLTSSSSGSGGSMEMVVEGLTEKSYHLPFVSQCEHHLLPFYGSLHVCCLLPEDAGGAMSEDEVHQIVETFTKRLQLQERICQQVAEAVEDVSRAAGVMVVGRAAHMCMVARGVENHGGSTVTAATRGVFNSSATMRLKCLREAHRRQEGSGDQRPCSNHCCSC